MSKPFDSTMKDLLDHFAIDWVSWLAPVFNLPATVQVQPCDVDLSTVQITADKVFQLCASETGYLHIEPQSSRDDSLPLRLTCYNLLINYKRSGPVHSVVVLLRREAQFPGLTGVFHNFDNLVFRYGIVRVWELDGEALLHGPIGSTPLALLTDSANGQLKEYVNRLAERYREANVPEDVESLLLTSGYILLGLRYTQEEIRTAFLGASGMQESVTYQAILREGEARGEARGSLLSRQADIITVLEARFGFITEDLKNTILVNTDTDRLKEIMIQAATIASLDELVI